MKWRDVVGFEGLYRVCDAGYVYSMKSKRVVGTKDRKGYWRVPLLEGMWN